MSGTMDYGPIIAKTQELLRDNPEWRDRYVKYVATITSNMNIITKTRSCFYEPLPLRLYLNTSNATKARASIAFDLRYLGENVARLTYPRKKLTISTAKYEKNNLEKYGCNIPLPRCAWDAPEATNFRKYFQGHPARRNDNLSKKNEEHRLESLLLYEFSDKPNKVLSNIKPVEIANMSFPMPTPLNASKHGKPRYSGPKGGGIDILARTGKGLRGRLCIIELKDENKKKEPASAALEQAIIYATFIRELLRNDLTGPAWWKLFGFGGEIPKPLTLFAACAMPYIEGADTSFKGAEYDLGDGDKVSLHYIYFEESGNEIQKIHTSLPHTKS